MLKNVIVMGYGKTFDIDGRSAQRVEEETLLDFFVYITTKNPEND